MAMMLPPGLLSRFLAPPRGFGGGGFRAAAASKKGGAPGPRVLLPSGAPDTRLWRSLALLVARSEVVVFEADEAKARDEVKRELLGRLHDKASEMAKADADARETEAWGTRPGASLG